MKKFILTMIIALMMVFNANAQIATENAKFFDNTYVGVAGGIETKASHQNQGAFAAFNPNATIIVGKDITPVFGVRAEGVVRFNAHGASCENGYSGTGKFVNGLDVNLLGTFNLNNLFAGYQGTPRKLEFIALYGFGWAHQFPTDVQWFGMNVKSTHNNAITSKAGLDVVYNFGSKKQWQAFIEPSITYAMQGYGARYIDESQFARCEPFQYNLNRANLELKAGIIYKFKTSNGTHAFKTYDVGEMQAEINNLRSELEKKPKEVVREVVKTVEVPAVQNATGFGIKETVFFAFNSAELDDNAKATLDNLGQNGVYVVRGYASNEGSAAYNKALSFRRAEAVANYLRERGAKVDTVEGLGVVFGPTTGRVAVITTK